MVCCSVDFWETGTTENCFGCIIYSVSVKKLGRFCLKEIFLQCQKHCIAQLSPFPKYFLSLSRQGISLEPCLSTKLLVSQPYMGFSDRYTIFTSCRFLLSLFYSKNTNVELTKSKKIFPPFAMKFRMSRWAISMFQDKRWSPH